MAKILVLYYSSYGHVEAMAQAQAQGAHSVAGAEVSIKRVPELMPKEAALAGADGAHLPSAKEGALASFQGRHVAQLAARTFG